MQKHLDHTNIVRHTGFNSNGVTNITNLEAAYADLTAAQDAFAPVAREVHNAVAAYKRSKSKANLARLVAANEAFDAALAICDNAHAAIETAEILDNVAIAQANRAAEVFAQPSLF